MARYRLNTLSDLARRGYALRIQCLQCDHRVEVDPTILRIEVHRLRRSQKLEDLEHELRCSCCGARQSHLTPFERE